jgi:hypothetical protein
VTIPGGSFISVGVSALKTPTLIGRYRIEMIRTFHYLRGKFKQLIIFSWQPLLTLNNGRLFVRFESLKRLGLEVYVI